jgi:hypothetical protein
MDRFQVKGDGQRAGNCATLTVCLLLALAPVRDLLLRAKHLLAAAVLFTRTTRLLTGKRARDYSKTEYGKPVETQTRTHVRRKREHMRADH